MVSFLQLYNYDNRDDFNFWIVNFPFMSSNIPPGPSYGIYIYIYIIIGSNWANL